MTAHGNGLRMPPRTVLKPGGFTLVELLIVLAVIGLLVALLLPAVQSAREAARRSDCRSRLRELGTAFQLHDETYGRFPSNGWGYQWVGEPDRGTDRNQPGGWIYNVLPHLEQAALRERGAGLSGLALQQELWLVSQTPLPVVRCPSRPAPDRGPTNPWIPAFNAPGSGDVAKTDYAVNEGDLITNTGSGPVSLTLGDAGLYVWADTSRATGVCFQRSEVRLRDVEDGASSTLLIGEKYVSTTGYSGATDPGYDQSWMTGVDLDLNRWTIDVPLQDDRPQQERRFGSSHASGCQAVLCDGSAHTISYSIDAAVFRSLGHRRDGVSAAVP